MNAPRRPTLAELIAGLPGVAGRLLDEHQPDHRGDCHVCSMPDRGPVHWPCALYTLAEAAAAAGLEAGRA